MPRPRKDGTLQLCLPLLTLAEKCERRAMMEAATGVPLGRHRRRRADRGEADKPRGKIAAAVAAGEAAASAVGIQSIHDLKSLISD